MRSRGFIPGYPGQISTSRKDDTCIFSNGSRGRRSPVSIVLWSLGRVASIRPFMTFPAVTCSVGALTAGVFALNPAERKAEALRLRAEHRSLRDIAKTLGVSVTQVRRDVADHEVGGTRDGTPNGTAAVQGEAHPDVPGTEKGFRERLRDDLESRLYPRMLELLEQAGKAKKRVWVSCPSCSKKSQVEIPDAKAALDVAEFYVNQGLGRPGVAEGDAAAQSFVMVNRIIIPCGHEECAEGFEKSEHTTIVLGEDVEDEEPDPSVTARHGAQGDPATGSTPP